jgi:hypothetical protein
MATLTPDASLGQTLATVRAAWGNPGSPCCANPEPFFTSATRTGPGVAGNHGNSRF